MTHSFTNSSSCTCSSGGPHVPKNLVLATGEFAWEQSDLDIPGRGIDFEWRLNYRSKQFPGQPNWSHSYRIRAVPKMKDIEVWLGSGFPEVYVATGKGIYSSDGVLAEGRIVRGAFKLRFSDGGCWTFRPLNAEVAPGWIDRIEDNNGNALNFVYDSKGLLTTVVDSLGRKIQVSYDAKARLSSITDFTGRQIQYLFNNDNQLKSVRYPVVKETPTGNNFAKGATVTFTYATAGLLTGISDRAGNSALAVEYGELSETGPLCTMILRGRDSGTKIHYAPAPQGTVVIVNDPMGNVQDYLLNTDGDCIRTRIYTGRADPSKSTTPTTNRPGKSLRIGEPLFYETRYFYSSTYHFLVRKELPSGGVILHEYEIDQNPEASPIQRGNLRTIRVQPGSIGADKSELVRTFEYLPGFGCTCGEAYVTRETDARGAITVKEFDQNGNVVRSVDKGGFVMSFRRNDFGELVERIYEDGEPNRRRSDTLRYSAQHGQLLSETLDATGLKLTTSFSYDDLGRPTIVRDPAGNQHEHIWNAWDRMVRRILPDGTIEDLQYDLDRRKVARTVNEAGLKMREVIQYDQSGRVSGIIEDVGPKRKSTRSLQYNANGKRVTTLLGDAKISRLEYDSRGLPLRRIRGQFESGAIEATFEYDERGNLVSVSRGEGAEKSSVRTTYDGYGRPLSMTFPDGSTTHVSCDANGNILRMLKNSPGLADPIETVTQTFDAMDRLVRRTTRRIGASQPIVETWEYDPRGRLIGSSANGITRAMRYDQLDRCVWRSENDVVTQFTFDPNSNLLSQTVTPTSGGIRLLTKYTVDQRGRTIRVDGPGEWFWEGKMGHRDCPVSVKTPGVQTQLDYDALGRMTKVVWDPKSKAPLAIELDWDDASRLVGLTDPNGNKTRFGFDHSDNPVATTTPDGKSIDRSFDSRGNCIHWKDANGTVVKNTYDLMDRLIRRVVAPGASVAKDTTIEDYSYDAFGRLASAKNNSHVVKRLFDPATSISIEHQDTRTITTSIDKQGRRAGITYSSGYQLTFAYKASALGVSDASGLAVELEGSQVRYPRIRLKAESNLNSMGLPERLTVSVATKNVLTKKYGWDAAGNATKIESTDARGAQIRTIGTDSFGRLVQSISPDSKTITYDLDSAGNRRSVQAAGRAGRYSMDDSDRIMNRYTLTPLGRRSYDANGNLIALTDTSGERRMKYDYKNRMVEHLAADGTLSRYTYDCLDRRLTKSITKGKNRDNFTYLYDGSELVEICNETTGAVQSLMRVGRTVFGISDSQSHTWFVSDAVGSPIAEFGADGAVRRFFEFDDYGEITSFDSDGEKRLAESSLPPILFAGYTFDVETGFLHTKTRYLEPSVGRFTTTDPAGAWFDPLSKGNAYAYAAHNPATYSDPTGLSTYRTYSCGGPWPGPRQITVEYEGCSKARRDGINHAVCWAFRGAGQAKRGVIARWVADMSGQPQPHSVSRTTLKYWFAGPDNAVSNYSKSYIGNRFGYIFDAIKSDDFDIDCENTSTCDDALAYVNHGGYDVNLCPSFWATLGDKTMGYILIHELSHAYADTDDYCYYFGYPSNQPGNALFETVDLRENADTYGCFVRDAYF
jgi:RHS repeat-associated protein